MSTTKDLQDSLMVVTVAMVTVTTVHNAHRETEVTLAVVVAGKTVHPKNTTSRFCGTFFNCPLNARIRP